MYPAQSDLKLYRGDYFEMLLRLREGNYEAGAYVPGDYLDLTGWTGKAQIRATTDATTVLAAFTVEILDQVDPATKGGVHLSLLSTAAAGLSTAAAVWDFQLTDPVGRVYTYLRGKVTVDKDVTR